MAEMKRLTILTVDENEEQLKLMVGISSGIAPLDNVLAVS